MDDICEMPSVDCEYKPRLEIKRSVRWKTVRRLDEESSYTWCDHQRDHMTIKPEKFKLERTPIA